MITTANALSIGEWVCFGIVICLAYGIYPALQVANINLIDALRLE
ncbi:MAG: hypothetical protein WCF90_05285 [Methanomicrobiales archaeon]